MIFNWGKRWQEGICTDLRASFPQRRPVTAALSLPDGGAARPWPYQEVLLQFSLSCLYFQPFGGTTLSLTHRVGGLAENTAPLMPLQLCEGANLSNQKGTQGRHLLLHLPFCGRYFSSFLAFSRVGFPFFSSQPSVLWKNPPLRGAPGPVSSDPFTPRCSPALLLSHVRDRVWSWGKPTGAKL